MARSSLFHAHLVVAAYRHLLLSPRRGARLLGLALLGIGFSARTARQWGSAGQLRLIVALLVAACEAALFTRPLLLVLAALACAAALVLAVAILPNDETGHRGGAEGFDGAPARAGETDGGLHHASCASCASPSGAFGSLGCCIVLH